MLSDYKISKERLKTIKGKFIQEVGDNTPIIAINIPYVPMNFPGSYMISCRVTVDRIVDVSYVF